MAAVELEARLAAAAAQYREQRRRDSEQTVVAREVVAWAAAMGFSCPGRQSRNDRTKACEPAPQHEAAAPYRSAAASAITRNASNGTHASGASRRRCATRPPAKDERGSKYGPEGRCGGVSGGLSHVDDEAAVLFSALSPSERQRLTAKASLDLGRHKRWARSRDARYDLNRHVALARILRALTRNDAVKTPG